MDKTTLKAENQADINLYYEDIRIIFDKYRTCVRPFISFLELFDGEFPVEILNEIRAILQHIARCYYCDVGNSSIIDDTTMSGEDTIQKRRAYIKNNIEKAKSHINRALLDCFKYSCLTLYDEYVAFVNLYKHVDLSSLDNGEFLKKLHILKTNAKLANSKARVLEGDSGDDTAVFRQYEEAFNRSVSLYKYITHHAKYAAKLKHKLRIHDILAAFGWIIGVVSGLHALWTAFGDSIIAFFTTL